MWLLFHYGDRGTSIEWGQTSTCCHFLPTVSLETYRQQNLFQSHPWNLSWVTELPGTSNSKANISEGSLLNIFTRLPKIPTLSCSPRKDRVNTMVPKNRALSKGWEWKIFQQEDETGKIGSPNYCPMELEVCYKLPAPWFFPMSQGHCHFQEDL